MSEWYRGSVEVLDSRTIKIILPDGMKLSKGQPVPPEILEMMAAYLRLRSDNLINDAEGCGVQLGKAAEGCTVQFGKEAGPAEGCGWQSGKAASGAEGCGWQSGAQEKGPPEGCTLQLGAAERGPAEGCGAQFGKA